MATSSLMKYKIIIMYWSTKLRNKDTVFGNLIQVDGSNLGRLLYQRCTFGGMFTTFFYKYFTENAVFVYLFIS